MKSVKSITLSPDVDDMELSVDGKLVTNDKELADIMCPFFKEKIEGIERKIPYIDISPTLKLEEHFKDKNMRFSLKTVTEAQVAKAIKSLKNKSSSGVDFISPKILKMAVDVVKVPSFLIAGNGPR